MTPQQNTMWSARVRSLLKEGYGVENIAVMMDARLDDVQREVEILRNSGELEWMFKGKGKSS